MSSHRLPAVLAVALAFVSIPSAPALAQGRLREKATALFQSGMKALQSEQFEAAERFFRSAIDADPQMPEPQCGLGQTSMVLRRYREAVQAYEKCKQLTLGARRRLQSEQARNYALIESEVRELKDSIQRIQTGQVKSQGEHEIVRLERAIQELERQKARDPIRVEVPVEITFSLANACLRAGELERAEREMLEALKAQPDAGEIHNNLAVVYVSMGRWAEAAEQIAVAEKAGFQVSPELRAEVESRKASMPVAPPPAPSQPSSEPAAPDALSLEHEARTCALSGRFVRVGLKLNPPTALETPVVRFRTEGEGDDWYSVRMSADESGDFSALLPRPRSAEAFRYFIEVPGQDVPVRTEAFLVRIARDATQCDEVSADPERSESILLVEPPEGRKSPVPRGFSIRGTTADVGVLELSSKKALLAGLIVGGGAAVAGVALATPQDTGFQGPQPFDEGPGIRFLDSSPPSGSPLSLSGTPFQLRLGVYSPDAIPGAQIVVEIAHETYPSACLILRATHDLPAKRTETVSVSGVVQRAGTCIPGAPLTELRVTVSDARGFGGFRTGLPPLLHIRVAYPLTE